MALWMCIPGAFFPLLTQAAMCVFVFISVDCLTDYFCHNFPDIKVLLFNLMVANVTLCSSLRTFFFFPHLSFSLFRLNFILLIFHMHGETLQKGQSWPGRKTCTFSIFVLCTALLILNPIIYYLNPSIKKKKSP